MEYPVPIKLTQDRYDESHSSIRVAVTHFSYQPASALHSLICLSQFYLKQFNQIHIITSSLDQDRLQSLQETLKQSEQIKVSCIDEDYLVNCLKKIKEEKSSGEHEKEGSTLVLFNDNSFCTGTIDLLIGEVDQVILISRNSIEEIMESYQVFKALRSIYAALQATLFTIEENRESDFIRIVHDEVPKILKRHLNTQAKIYSLYPAGILDEPVEHLLKGDCYKHSDVQMAGESKIDLNRRNHFFYEQLLLA